MILTILLCTLFFLGYLIMRSHGQALAFLLLGAGYQVLTFVVPPPEDTAPVSFDTFALVCLFSVAGYIAWRVSRRYLENGLFGKHRLGVFAGLAANALIAAFILWQTGTIDLPK